MDDELDRLNRRYRLGVGLAAGLAFVLLATLTAKPDNDRDQRLGTAPAAGGEVLGSPDAPGTGSPARSSAPQDPSPSAGRAGQTGGEPRPGSNAGERPDATSSTNDHGGTATGPASASSPGPSEQGVSATEIVIAFTRIDPAFYARFGIPDPEAEKGIQAFVEHVNREGGIAGRAIRPVIITQSDPRFPEPSQQTCRTAFLDHRAFMMINDQRWPGMVECATRLARPISDLGSGLLAATSESLLRELGGRYWIGAMNVERLARLWVEYIATHLEGREQKIGILEHYNEDLTYASEVVQREMRAAGFKKPSVFKHTEDISTAAIQANNAIAQWRRDGVTLVVPVTNAVPVGIGQRAASSQNYHPKWTFSAIGGLDQTDYATFYDDRQFNGSTGVTFARLPSQPGQERCRQIFLARWAGSDYSSQQSAWCHMILLNAEALRRAGPQLTLQTWSGGFASLGTYHGNHVGRGRFAPDKYDGADQVQVLRYQGGTMSSASPFVDGF